MNKSKNKPTPACREIEAYLTEHTPGTGASDSPPQIKRHLESCVSCRRFADTIAGLQRHLQMAPLPGLEPDPAIEKNLLEEFDRAFKPAQSQNGGIFPVIQKIINFRIPVYQLAGAALILLVTIGVTNLFDESYQAGRLTAYQSSDSSALNQFLELRDWAGEKKAGKNATEDSILTKFLTTY